MARITVKPPTTTPLKNRQDATKVKIATSNLFIFDEKNEASDYMADAVIEDIGGQEIINLTRNDLLNGQSISYGVVKNIADAAREFNPGSLIPMQGIDSEFFAEFPFSLGNYVPDVGDGINLAGENTGETAYVSPQTGEIVIDLIKLSKNQKIEVEFITYSEAITGTEYPLA